MIKEHHLENLQLSADHDVLDSTRIHPELYSVALRMAKSALDIEEGEDIVKKAMN